MKKVIVLLIVTISLFSCGSGDQSVSEIIENRNLEEIRAKKTEITLQQNQIEAQLKSLDSAIAILGNEEKFPLVNTLTAKKEVFNHYLELQGDVSTKQNVLIYPEMAGTLQKVYVKEGDRVSKGQLLATIDDGGMSSQLSQLKSQATLAKTTFERQERLWKQNIGSEIQYLQAKTNYESSENMVSQAQSQLGKSSIRAPFSGIIDNVIKDQGTVVAPGQGSEVFRLVNLSDMFIEVEVPETYLGSVVKGKEALVYFPVLGDSITTKIRETGNFINPSNRSFEVEIPVPNKEGKIKPNLTAKVNINDYTSENAILIPTSIISENAEGEQYVFVAEEPNSENEAIVKRIIITTGKTQGAKIEVLSGLEDGNLIIKEGARSVKDGQKVKIKK
ncbi:RND family efflux transporter, MFP subunit [Maribacter orientalis]|uniref:RND family efflux transporter, MFP subunit n=1 Tax=Maribacter orientalis TaxID=228957 RepID=A0A1H7RYF8_9FLAO|nr:efflux RND transporter periplasmic adaptor subunit [Maribacter orientalis]SEL65330.1 RND family efflux transporter, MFP subunit [Maribacter orientalis]